MSVIWVVCDRFSKMVHLVPLVKLPSSSDLVPLFFQHVVRLHGIPENIVSDRGSQFVSRFWRAFCGRMGIDLSFSSAFHPQTNGQTERTNQTLETYLRCFVSADQDDWVSFLPLAEFALNNRASSATLVSPFFCNSGFHPRFSSGQVESSDCPGVDYVVDRLQQIWTQVVDNLTLSQEKAQLFANRRRRVGPRLRVGDLVWLSSRHIPMKVSSPKFKPRFIGPYRISEILNPVSFRLTLPDSFSIHNVFHRSLLRRYVAPMVPSVEPPAPVLVEGELEYIVEKILDSRVSRRKLQYLVKWKGYAQEDNSWVFASDVHAPDLVRAFHVAHPGRPGGSACYYLLLEALRSKGVHRRAVSSARTPALSIFTCSSCGSVSSTDAQQRARTDYVTTPSDLSVTARGRWRQSRTGTRSRSMLEMADSSFPAQCCREGIPRYLGLLKCEALELKQKVPVGVLKKEIVSQEEKKKHLSEKIQKQQEKLDSLQSPVSVSRPLRPRSPPLPAVLKEVVKPPPTQISSTVKKTETRRSAVLNSAQASTSKSPSPAPVKSSHVLPRHLTE
ncbi:unnamed protein product [Ranitomeya imitator]|uniref:Uncharacterized protein n=1 Tax=Ranitomeya imitator TaxID=111125 RepID=A0ABN9MD45_9NEOB|nr:unnamed protein product [Ranitomeya imitator]